MIFLKYYIIITAYLLGSIPSAIWIGKIFFNTDIREHGSKNAGATNAIRVLGYKAGLPVFIIDALKGFLAVNLILFIKDIQMNENQIVNFQLLLGLCAISGHIFPVFAKFKGGKGVATLLGIFLAIAPIPTLLAFGVFVLVLILSRYVSVSSMTAGLTFPVFIYFFQHPSSITLQLVSITVFILLIVTHRKNIKRLIKRKESKFSFKKSS